MAGRWLPVARAAARTAAHTAASRTTGQSANLARQWGPAAKQSGRFVKHVLPAAVKPLHVLWHQILGFMFLVFAGLAAWKVWRNEQAISPPIFVIAVIFIVVMAAYGVSSIRKSQRISRS
jgi:glycerol uptake facilitator-like aquaporin